MKILILTQYFPPEVGAPQNRLYELAIRLKEHGVDITVLTAMPNYPKMEIHESYKGKWYSYEIINELKVHRSWIYVSKSKSILKRLINYFSFVISSTIIGSSKLKRFDYILCESPPLFLGISAYILTKLKHAQLIFNVSDLWPESAEKLGLVTNRFFLSLSTRLEEFMYKKAVLITGQTQGICTSIQARFPTKKVYWLSNGVDLNFYNYAAAVNNWRTQNGFLATDFILTYGGIIGHAQGLEVILKAASYLINQQHLKFILIGNGPEKEKLLQLKKELQLHNVFIFNTIDKNQMPEVIAASDVAIIPLKRLELFKGAIPSKIFENLAMKKPILLGVEGEAKELFIDKGQCGLAFTPEDATDLASKIKYLLDKPEVLPIMGENGYNYVKQNFTRDEIANRFWSYLIRLH